ncbi:hypothetical protein [Nonomuraea sp. NPDC048826]|uniref:hypothetical protein n=1 Tax=Nonomuraea sp. NPDC048826 TaxID=3364347 RepID=UPI00371E5080
MSTKSTEERVSALESWAFQTGRDLAEIKAAQAEHTNRLAAMDARLTGMDTRLSGMDTRLSGMDERMTGMDERMAGMDERMTGMETQLTGVKERMIRLEHGVGLLLDHYGIQRLQP